MLFEDAYEEYKIYAKTRHKKQGFDTIENNFKNHVLPYFKGRYVKDINIKDIIIWQNIIIKKEFSNAFNSSIYLAYSKFLNYCVLLKYTQDNVVKRVGNFPKKFEKKTYNVYTPNEFRKFRKGISNRIYKEYFNFMYFYGTRPSECIALRFNDIENYTVHIRNNIHRRGKRLLDTPKNVSSIRDIKIDVITKIRIFILKCYYIKLYGNCCDDYFIFGGKKPLATTTIDRYKEKACKKVGIKKIKTHEFRHSYATWKIHNKVPIDYVSKSLGHSKVSTTVDIYLHQEKRTNKVLSPLRLKFLNTIENNFKKVSQYIITRFIV